MSPVSVHNRLLDKDGNRLPEEPSCALISWYAAGVAFVPEISRRTRMIAAAKPLATFRLDRPHAKKVALPESNFCEPLPPEKAEVTNGCIDVGTLTFHF
jgi:hypothetical protein